MKIENNTINERKISSLSEFAKSHKSNSHYSCSNVDGHIFHEITGNELAFVPSCENLNEENSHSYIPATSINRSATSLTNELGTNSIDQFKSEVTINKQQEHRASKLPLGALKSTILKSKTNLIDENYKRKKIAKTVVFDDNIQIAEVESYKNFNVNLSKKSSAYDRQNSNPFCSIM